MASIFMKISAAGKNMVPAGAATLTMLDSADESKNGWFAIDNMSWGAMRGVSIDIGNANNQDGGMVAMGEVSIARSYDGATPYLMSFLLKPGSDGKQIDIIMTKPHREGQGLSEYYRMTLEGARVANYNLSGTDGGQPAESLSFTYTKITQKCKIEDADGSLTDGQTVTYDATNNTAPSLAS